jgi:transcriptional regulator with XRE-family HTH domain
MAGTTIGMKVRTVRESRGLTLEQLAERSGVDREMAAQVEAGALVPSLAPLVRIARALGVRLGTFLDDHENVGPVTARAEVRVSPVRFSGHGRTGPSDLDFYPLAANKAGRNMEPFLVDLHPSSADAAKPSTHEGEEFLHVLAGAVEVSYGLEVHRLGAGDSIYYDSIVPHHVHAAGGKAARILAVVYAPA